ncbi:hypothetical protein Tco_0397416 [Tanacetum coccineum]
MGAQSHALASAFDYEQQKVEERGKNGVPNKRTRTSMVDQKADVCPNTPARSSGSIERDKEVRLPNDNALQGADRALPVVGDNDWLFGKWKHLFGKWTSSHLTLTEKKQEIIGTIE